MRFSRQEYWSGLPRPPSGGFPDLVSELASAYVSCIAGGFCTQGATWEAQYQTSKAALEYVLVA